MESTPMSKFLSARHALALDQELMGKGAFSLDQLMELAGLSVSQVIHTVHPQHRGKNILIACGPGNNGGDGLVAARHLKNYGYHPTIYYPKRNRNDLFQRLSIQLDNLCIPFTDDFGAALDSADHVVDAIFGFSFHGEVREPFRAAIKALEDTSVPITSVDVPSSWHVENGPPISGLGSKFNPAVLVSLSAPKPLVSFFKGRHFVGGRFIPPMLQERFNLQNYDYQGVSQIIEIEEKEE